MEIIYRKRKQINDEIRVIMKAIWVLEDVVYDERAQTTVTGIDPSLMVPQACGATRARTGLGSRGDIVWAKQQVRP